MSPGGAALLLGLVVPPLLLLWLGHGYRTRSKTARTAFWGGVLGYIVAALAVNVAALAPPVRWDDAGARALLVHGGLLVGPAFGLLVGGLAGRRARRRAA